MKIKLTFKCLGLLSPDVNGVGYTAAAAAFTLRGTSDDADARATRLRLHEQAQRCEAHNILLLEIDGGFHEVKCVYCGKYVGHLFVHERAVAFRTSLSTVEGRTDPEPSVGIEILDA